MADTPHIPVSDPEAKERRQHAQRQLVLAYKRCFSTTSGKTVLADLKRAFGWERWEAKDTENADLIARRCAAKGPIFHIEEQLRTVFRDGKKTKRRGEAVE